MELDFDQLLQGSERIRIVQLLEAADGWRLVHAWPIHASEGDRWDVEALRVVCWALTHRTNPDGVIDHGVEAVVWCEGMLMPHGDLDGMQDLLPPGVPFAPEHLHARLSDHGPGDLEMLAPR